MRNYINRFPLFTLIFIFFFIYCEKVTAPMTPPSQRQLTQHEQMIVDADNQFGLSAFKAVVGAEGEKNVFISPLSISMALGMTLNGAAGETRQAMVSTLEMQGLTQQQINESYQSLLALLQNLDPKVKFEIANSIWYRNTMNFKQDFIQTNQKYFDALVKGLDFANPQSVSTINNWVKEKTNGKIPTIINQISPLDIMFLINAIYFKGTWEYQFVKERTSDAPFHLPDGSEYTCKMMRVEGGLPYLWTDDFQAVDLPYGNGDFRMTIFLPQPNRDLDSFIASINQSEFSSWLGKFRTTNGLLELPKFKMEYEISLNNVLTQMGMGIAFSPSQADFTNLYEGPQNAYISEVKHKTFVQVDEEGTEAAAVTSVTVGVTSIGREGFHVIVNRPFFFVIRDSHSDTILFAGKIVKPVWE
jgi:serine protease inhibitor